jgi:voltage-gated potassium channel
MSLLHGHPPVLLGEGVELMTIPVPASLAGTSLAASGIGSRTGLSVVAIQEGERMVAPLALETVLPGGAQLIVLGSDDQRAAFAEAFEKD